MPLYGTSRDIAVGALPTRVMQVDSTNKYFANGLLQFGVTYRAKLEVSELMRSAILVFVIFSTLGLAAQVTTTTKSIGGREISLARSNGSSSDSVGSITTKSIQLQPGQSVQEMLQQSGVEPNSDALSVVYSLNPGIYRLTDASSYTVKILAVEGFNPSLATPVRLMVDSALKQSIVERSNRLAALAVSKPADMRSFLSPAVDALKETSVSITVHPISSSLLGQVERESSLLTEYSNKAGLTDDDKAKIAEINSDLRAKDKALQTDAPDPDVIVRTLAAKDQSEVGLLTICYTPVFLDNGKCDAEFERPSSPTDHRLPVANYHMWAANTLGVRVSEVKRVEVRDTTTIVLVVTQ
jgi:hypothetical protein